MLERQMQEIRDLPDRVTGLESQVLQLRQEMRDEFSATRAEFRSELGQAVTTLRGETAATLTTLRGEIAAAVTTLANAIADTNTHMRALHEDALSRIATSARVVSRGKSDRHRRRV